MDRLTLINAGQRIEIHRDGQCIGSIEPFDDQTLVITAPTTIRATVAMQGVYGEVVCGQNAPNRIAIAVEAQ